MQVLRRCNVYDMVYYSLIREIEGDRKEESDEEHK